MEQHVFRNTLDPAKGFSESWHTSLEVITHISFPLVSALGSVELISVCGRVEIKYFGRVDGSQCSQTLVGVNVFGIQASGRLVSRCWVEAMWGVVV